MSELIGNGLAPSPLASNRPGKLKIFLGYAAGVGKTYQMLEEAQSLLAKGVDVAIGYFEPHGRKDTIGKTSGLETIPRKIVEYRGSTFQEMDAEAIVARHPRVAVVDEFPHTNVPGSPREKRWQDVLYILENGIDVLTTMNVQHLESLNDQMAQITGVKVRETIPDWVVTQAGEVVMVDVTPRALLNRLERGVVYPADKAKRALEHFFKESTLVALREMALRQTAHEVEDRLEQEGLSTLQNPPGSLSPKPEPPVKEAIVIYISDDPSTAMLIRRGKRVADVLHADCFAVFVAEHSDLQVLPAAKRESVERHLNFARNLHIETRVLIGTDHAQTIVEFARLHHARQVFLPRLVGKGMDRMLGKSFVNRVVGMANDMEVTIVADRRQERPVKG
jgi:two-component system, OmpR family, sensor histidine kinase KdpD